MTHRLLIVAAVTASVATLVAGAPAVAQERNPWSGFYVGGTLGGAWGDTSIATHTGPGSAATPIPPVDVSAINAAASAKTNAAGFTGGVEGGYNWVGGGVLLGLETDWGWLNIHQSSSKTVNSALLITPPVTYTINQHLKTDWIGTVRPRVGLATDRWLFYATGGLAFTELKYTMNYADTRTPPQTAILPINDTKTGWAAGVGVAYAFNPNWSVKGEWLYANFGHVHSTASTADGFVDFSSNNSVRANLLRVGVDYRF